MADIKWSAFPSTTATAGGDVVVGLHSGANERFLVSPSPAASAIALWDANKNLSNNNNLTGYATTVTSGITTTLVVGSAYQQYFTGSSTQTVQMPAVATLVLGQSYLIANASSANVTVQSSGGNTIVTLPSNSQAILTCIAITGTTAASWSSDFNQQTPVGITRWLAAPSTPITAAINTGYYITDASTVTITLPVTAAAGSVVGIVGNGAGGWVLAPGAGQTIQVLGDSASTSVASAAQYDCIEVLCVVANTTWVARSAMTTGFTIS